MLYEITTNDGLGSAEFARRYREDAARHLLCRYVRQAAKAQALLDRPPGVRAWDRATAWRRRHGDIALRIGCATITLHVDATWPRATQV